MNVSTKILSLCALTLAMGSCHKAKVATAEPAVLVKVQPVENATVTSGHSYSGTVEESEGSTLSFAAVGTVRSINVKAGDRVAQGQLIGTLDDTNLRNAYDIAKAALNQAQDAYDRFKLLHDAQALPDIKWVEAQNALSSAKSAEAIARKALDDAKLYSPRSGYVAEKMAETGMNVAPGIPVVKVVDIDPVKVAISIPENEIADMAEGAKAAITVGALGGKQYEGSLAEKGVTANILSRSYDVKFKVANPERELLPGMICEVSVENATPRSVVVVPAEAVLLDAENQNFVWIAKDGAAHKRIVGVGGLTPSTRIIISSGLAAGDSVIVAGQQKVSDGTPVRF